MTKKEILKEIKDALEEDIGNWCPEDEDDVDSWAESCIDCPSNCVEEAIKLIPKGKDYTNEIDCLIGKVADSVKEEMEEEEEEEEE